MNAEESLTPTTVYLVNSLTDGTYEASVSINSSSQIENGQEVTLIAGQEILLEGDFEVPVNSSFEATIQKNDEVKKKKKVFMAGKDWFGEQH